MESFASAFRRIREGRGLSRSDVDDALAAPPLDKRPGYCSQLENNRIRPPDREVCEALEPLLNMKPGELWNLSAPMRIASYDPNLWDWHLEQISQAPKEADRWSRLAEHVASWPPALARALRGNLSYYLVNISDPDADEYGSGREAFVALLEALADVHFLRREEVTRALAVLARAAGQEVSDDVQHGLANFGPRRSARAGYGTPAPTWDNPEPNNGYPGGGYQSPNPTDPNPDGGSDEDAPF